MPTYPSTSSPSSTPPSARALMRRAETDLSGFIEKVAADHRGGAHRRRRRARRFARELDKADLDAGAPEGRAEAEFDAAFGMVDEDVIAAIRFAIDNIRRFHEEQKPEADVAQGDAARRLCRRPLHADPSVALYVPRGKGAFPSVTMMTAVPAVVAGVPEIAIVTPPAPDGSVDAATLVAARLAGVETVYKCGGAQAVAAVAYGTETVGRRSRSSVRAALGWLRPSGCSPESSIPACRPGRRKRSSSPTTPWMAGSPRSTS